MHVPTSGPVAAPSKQAGALPTIGGKYTALVVLFAMNLLNYVDRYSFFAAGTHIQSDLHIDDYWFGVLGVSFMIVYTIVSPAMGWMGDRYNRKMLLAGGVGLWSLATVGTAFSADFYHMFFWRALLGLGEASYGAIAPALISDLFAVKERGRAMGVYYLALPFGTALGYIVGGKIADSLGWPAVFLVVGFPGLIAAAAGLVMNDPGRGASEGNAPSGEPPSPKRSQLERQKNPGDSGARFDPAGPAGGAPEPPRFGVAAGYLELFRTRTFVYNTAGMAAVTFATGAYAAWGSTFYQRVHGLSATVAGRWIGLLLVGAGLLGIFLGMFLPDLLLKLTRRAYLLLAALAVIAAIPLGVTGILDPQVNVSLGCLFGASILLSMVLGPCNTVTANVVPANQRAFAYASFIFLIHLFGDISSPVIVGKLSKLCGKPEIASSLLGRFFVAIGAAPVENTNLTVGMLSVAPVLVLGSVFFVLGSRHLAQDQDKARAAGGGAVDADALAPFHP
jgi:MFS family permease